MLEIHDDNGIRELRLARPPVNALDPSLVAAIGKAVHAAPDEGARAIVLSGQPGVFSAGLDVPTLLKLDRGALQDFVASFFAAQAAIVHSPIPVIAALTGHAPAGGTVLAILCDYRIMAEGAFRIGLNEVEVGLTPGPVIGAAYARLVGTHRAAALITRGGMIDPATALAMGLIDETCAPEQVVERARAHARVLLDLPPRAMSRARDEVRASLKELYSGDPTPGVETFVSVWFGEETQARLASLFTKKR